MVTFAQNNGVIQLTGVASRFVALFIAGILVLLGLFEIIGAVLQLMPKPVLGGATLIIKVLHDPALPGQTEPLPSHTVAQLER
jgi:hypothetical protein